MKSKKILWTFAALFVVFAMLLSACSSATPTEAPEAEEPAAEEPMEEPEAEEPAAEEPMEEEAAFMAPPGGELEKAMAGEYAGTTVVVDGPFTDADEVKFNESMKPFEDATGIDVNYIGNKEFEGSISVRVDAGDAPDIADFPQPGLLARFVSQGSVVDPTTFIPEGWLEQQYNPSWLEMGTMEGPDGEQTAGIWHRFNGKSLVWYPVDDFEAAGYEVPTTWEELIALSDMIVADGDTPWCVGIESGAATGWPATDWMEEFMLRTTSLENYDAWTVGELPFASPEVKNAAETLGELWFNEDYVYGGTASIVSTFFGDAPTPMFEEPPKCWMHKQGNFITAFFPEGTEADVDYSFFYLPPIDEAYGKPFLVAGDIMAMFNDRPEVRALMEYFTLPESATGWLETGGALAAHQTATPEMYGVDLEKGIAALVNEATSFRFDGSDLMPGEVGAGSFWKGMTDWVSGAADLDTVLSEIDASWPTGVEGQSSAPAEEEMADLSGELEIYSWWAGDEGPALEALIALYGEMYPNVEVVNATVAGGSGTEAKAVLKTRMLGGDPPDTFQVHAGQELIGTWVVADAMEDLTDLYNEEGWFDKYPPGLLELMSTDDGIWSVPVNIHRSNVLWFIPENLEGWGVEVPATWDDFLAICPTLQDQGVVPLALGRNWTHNHLWEAVAVSELGEDGWNALWTGEKAFTDPDVVATWDLFGQILDCTNEDATSLSWQQATDLVISGDAAFNEMGDWAMTYFTVINELEPGVDYNWAPSPGTDGLFIALSDSFGLPKGAPNADNVLAWLSLMGSVEGQDAFNPLKGSIAAHFDTDLTKYNAYLQSAAEDWTSDTVVGSLAHGAVANETFMNGFASAMEVFLSTRSAEATSQALQELCVESEICQ